MKYVLLPFLLFPSPHLSPLSAELTKTHPTTPPSLPSRSELLTVPSDLRICLETCLSDTPSQATLERHLPKVRQIIIGLLHGLREKQRLYRDGAAARRVRETKEREAERDRIAMLAREGLIGRGSFSGGSSSTSGGSGSLSGRGSQTTTTTGQNPMTPNSASRSRDELRKFVTQAQATENTTTTTGSTRGSQSVPGTRSVSPSTGYAPPPPLPTMALPPAPPTTTSSSSSSAITVRPPLSTSSSTSSFVSTSTSGNRYEDISPTSTKPSSIINAPPSSSSSSSSVATRRPDSARRTHSTDDFHSVPGGPPSTTSTTRQSKTISSRSSRSSHESTSNQPTPTPSAPVSPTKSSTHLANSLGNFTSSVRHGGGGSRPYSPPPPPRNTSSPVPVPLTPTFDLTPVTFDQPPPSGSISPTSSSSQPAVLIRPPSTYSIDSTSGGAYTPASEGDQSAAQLESLEALKASDHLSRRASKRYSAYAIQKMTSGPGGGGGSPMREKGEKGRRGGGGMEGDGSGLGRGSGSGSSAGRELANGGAGGGGEEKGGRGQRKGKSEFRTMRGADGERVVVPPLPSLPSSLSERDLKSVALGGGGGGGGGLGGSLMAVVEEGEGGSSREASPALGGGPPTFPPPPLPTGASPMISPMTVPTSTLSPILDDSPSISQQASPTLPSSSADVLVSAPPPSSQNIAMSPLDSSEGETDYPISVFLQIGRDVKKAKLDSIPTISSLRILFVERFQFNPGQNNFPPVYLRDPMMGVHYELEDLNEVKNGSVISLNIDSASAPLFFSLSLSLSRTRVHVLTHFFTPAHSRRTSQAPHRPRTLGPLARHQRASYHRHSHATSFRISQQHLLSRSQLSRHHFTFDSSFGTTVSRNRSKGSQDEEIGFDD